MLRCFGRSWNGRIGRFLERREEVRKGARLRMGSEGIEKGKGWCRWSKGESDSGVVLVAVPVLEYVRITFINKKKQTKESMGMIRTGGRELALDHCSVTFLKAKLVIRFKKFSM